MAGNSSKSYARNLLEKYGWTEGKGLGKSEHGMVEALKPKLKFDNAGIGHDHAEQFTLNWWEIAFNEAAKRVSVDAKKDGSNKQLEANEYSISTKHPSIAKLMKENPLKYGKFIKTETLTGGDLVPVQEKVTLPEDNESRINALSSNMSDEELFKICGGRTAHKAARHGHKLVGKLARVIEQEKKHLSSLESGIKKEGARSESVADVNSVADRQERVRKKKKRRKKDSIEVEENGNNSDLRCSTDYDAVGEDIPGMTDKSDSVGSPDCKEERGKKKKKDKHCTQVSDTESEDFKCSKRKKKNRCSKE